MNPGRQGRAIGYTRVSTAEQADSGASLAAQESAIRAECERRGWTLVSIATDAGVSGATVSKRPALLGALATLDSGEADTLVVAKLDRLSRSVVDLGKLVERADTHGWGLAVLDLAVDTTTASGELVANVMGSVAQWERRIIAERTKAALAAKRAAGVRLGRPPVLPQEVRDRIVAMRDAGASWPVIARTLNDEGVPTAHSATGTWYPNTARRIYNNERRERPEAGRTWPTTERTEGN